MADASQKVTLLYDTKAANDLLAASGDAGKAIGSRPTSLVVIYSYGDFRAATKVARSDDQGASRLRSRAKAACQLIR